MTFDPLKEMLRNIIKNQHELEIEVKLMKDNLNEKCSKEQLEKTNSQLARIVNSTENNFKKVAGEYPHFFILDL